MIADAHLDIHREAHSTPWLMDLVFDEANHLGFGRYFLKRTRAVEDDHLPFLDLGIPAIEIINLDYGPFNFYRHSPFDTLEKCSPATMEVVGDAVSRTTEELGGERERPLHANLNAKQATNYREVLQ